MVKVMKVKMLKSALGSENGIEVKEYQAGEVYEVSESLAKDFLSLKVAEAAKEEKAVEEAPKNKAISKAEKNK